MVAKISSTENLRGALGYNFKKVEQGKASILLTSGLYGNLHDSYTMREVLIDMQACLPRQCRTKKIVFHCSLNPHPDEQLSDETLRQIAGEYMEALGYGKQPYIVFKHSDISREHIHIVSLRVDHEGKKINDKFEGRRSKTISDAIEQKYGLIPSTRVSKPHTLSSPIGIDLSQGQVKRQVSRTLRSVLKHYRFCSLGELNAILSRYHLIAEEVKTEFRGKHYDGLVYAPTDSAGNKIATPIKATEIARGTGYSAVTALTRRSKQTLKPYIPAIRKQVRQAMQSSPKSLEELQRRLGEDGLRAYIRTTVGGHIYGITFIDDSKGIALNGSRLGKGYSANRFEAYFSDTTRNPFLDENLYGHLPSTSKQEREAPFPDEPLKEEGSENLIEEVLGDLIGEIPLSIGNDDWKETAWQRKLRRQANSKSRRR